MTYFTICWGKPVDASTRLTQPKQMPDHFLCPRPRKKTLRNLHTRFNIPIYFPVVLSPDVLSVMTWSEVTESLIISLEVFRNCQTSVCQSLMMVLLWILEIIFLCILILKEIYKRWIRNFVLVGVPYGNSQYGLKGLSFANFWTQVSFAFNMIGRDAQRQRKIIDWLLMSLRGVWEAWKILPVMVQPHPRSMAEAALPYHATSPMLVRRQLSKFCQRSSGCLTLLQ